MIPFTLQRNSVVILEQLISLLEQIEPQIYQESVPVLSGGSINKHVRHIIEFYTCLFEGLSTAEINYDVRPRNPLIETDASIATQALQEISRYILKITEDRALYLRVAYFADEGTCVPTTLYRELIYNLEHCIHHMATIRIALESNKAPYSIPETFGVAPSTIQHQRSICVQ